MVKMYSDMPNRKKNHRNNKNNISAVNTQQKKSNARQCCPGNRNTKQTAVKISHRFSAFKIFYPVNFIKNHTYKGNCQPNCVYRQIMYIKIFEYQNCTYNKHLTGIFKNFQYSVFIFCIFIIILRFIFLSIINSAQKA